MRITTGKQLREYRKNKGWDIWEMASFLGCLIKDINNAEKAPNRNLSRRMQSFVDNAFCKKTGILARVNYYRVIILGYLQNSPKSPSPNRKNRIG